MIEFKESDSQSRVEADIWGLETRQETSVVVLCETKSQRGFDLTHVCKSTDLTY